MKIAVAGLWHLGSVTAACLAKAGHEVIAYDADQNVIANYALNKTPIYEPGLNELVVEGKQNKKLHYTMDASELNQVNFIWVTFDTPVDDHDIADVDFVTTQIQNMIPHLQNHTLILISSQVPVGTTRSLQEWANKHYSHKQISFAYSPENLRLGKAISVFTQPDRIVVGCDYADEVRNRIEEVLNPITNQIVWMSIESAEMTKHALNAFLATSVVFINELASICEKVGADAREVEHGLKTEERIGAKAYLRPGAAIAGGTLARDVNFLVQIGNQQHLNTPLFSSLLASNHAHKEWSCRRLLDVLKNLKNKTVATLGLTYKAGTDTLRRSTAIETCKWISQQGAKVVAFDPVVKDLPSHLADFIHLKSSIEQTLKDVDAIVITTEWPQFISITANEILNLVKEPVIFDASGFLMKELGQDARIKYFSVGRSA